MPRTLHKLLCQTGQKEITFQDRLNLHQFFLRRFKIKVDIKRKDEFCDRVCVLIRFLPDNFDEVADLFLVGVCVAFAELGGDDCGGDVADYPGTGGLNGVYEGRGEEEFAELFAAVGGVEEGEEGPVDQPRSMVQLYRWIREGLLSKNVMERDVLCR